MTVSYSQPPIETVERHGLVGRIEYDDLVDESPRDWDSNLGTIIYWHRDHVLGERGALHERISPDEFLREAKENGYLYLPISLLDHSGLHVWVGAGPSPFDPGGWDSGQVGWIYVEPEQVRKEYGKKRITKKVREQVLALLRGEIETFDQYLSGAVYGYVVDDKHGEHVDSCWGFYGLDYVQEALGEALEANKEHASNLEGC